MIEMKKYSWIKDSLIQIIFISVAVIFTVVIAQITISEQYTAYHEGKLEEKAQSLARNAALMFSENDLIRNVEGINFFLSGIFPQEYDGAEIIRYALFTPDGRVAVSTVDGEVFLPDEVLQGEYDFSYAEGHIFRAFSPVYADENAGYILMIHIDDTPFLEYGQELSANLYASLIRGCLMMAAGYAVFTIISNLRKKKAELTDAEKAMKAAEEKRNKKMMPRLLVQFISMTAAGLLAVPFLFMYIRTDGILNTVALLLCGLFFAMSGAHLIRILLWFFSWYSKKPISGYAAQTMQFLIFLLVFLTLYSFSIQNGYRTQIEFSIKDELRTSSMFAALSLSGGEFPSHLLAAQAREMDFGEHSDCIVIVQTETGFEILGDETRDISYANELFFSAWEGQASVTGLRGENKYGVTAIISGAGEVMALAAIRQPAAVQATEMRSATIDFLLAMSATVFAFAFLFIEINKILEVVNVPDLEQKHGLRYAKGVRSLMFLASACRYIPLYFFVIIVRDIYEFNPISFIPAEVAMVLPIAIVVVVMAVGGGIVGKFVRLKSRVMLILGCIIGAAGFFALTLASTLPLLLLLLFVAYTGLSMVYNGLWDFAAETDLKEQTLSGEYLGGMAGAVIGAMVFDKIGLFAAFALSAVVLLVLIALIFTMLPEGEEAEHAEKREFGFLRFFFSKRIFLYMFLLLMPFVFGEYFIEQFSPLYADSISLSPGAASWASLLMTMALAFVAPSIVRLFFGRLSNTAICVFTNILAACGLVLFAYMPGIIGMYAAAALIGLSIGVGKNIINEGFEKLEETKKYANSGSVYNLFDSLFGLLGAALFTLAHALSQNGEYIMSVAAIIIVATILYTVFSRKRGNA
jgi:MFS family permease